MQPLVRGEADDDTIVITSAVAWIGPEYDLDDVSLTTGFTISTRLLQDSHFAAWCGPDAGTLPDIRMYHPEEFQGAIASEIKNKYDLVLTPPHFAYNWIGPVSTTVSPWHTSEDVLIT